MAFGLEKKSSGRRQRAKQIRAESSLSLGERFLQRIGWWPTLVALSFFSLALLIGFTGGHSLPYRLNQRIDRAIVARVNFTVKDPKKAAANIQAARESVPNYYTVNTEFIDRIISDLTAMYEAAQAESFEEFKARAQGAIWPADQKVYEYLRAADDARRERYKHGLEQLEILLRKERTARPTALTDRTPPSTATEVVIQPPAPPATGEDGPPAPEQPPQRVATIQLIQVGSREAIEGRAAKLALVFDYPLTNAISTALTQALMSEPILVFDQKRTQEEMIAAEKTAPPGEIHFERGQPFVFPPRPDADGNTPRMTGLTLTDLDLLATEEAAYQAFLASNDPAAVKERQTLRYESYGKAIAMLLLTCALFLYVRLYQPRVLEVRTRTIALAGLLLLCLGGVRLIDLRLNLPEFALTPVLLAASILAIAYPPRFAVGVVGIFVIMAGLVLRADVGLLFALMAGGFVTALQLNDIRTRTKLITAGAITGAVCFVTTFAFGLIDHDTPGAAIAAGARGAGAAMLAALIIQGALPFIERVFKVATALTLLEYRDVNKPLVQRLAREAPGTYNHSLVLGTMAEAACEAIGANGLLAHVGALYHDVGKIPKAEYFAENQEAAINRHDALAPSMSLLIILGHVKDGLELAREYGLPRVLFPFIAEHHGTTVVKYFHHVASEKQPKIASGKHDREVAETEFRYPGPKPSSKETAILMLCDGVEGAVRALHEPTAGRIESIVHQVLQARLKDGQFDDCDITLKELHKVEESLVKSLCRFYHGRVAYPKDSKDSGSRTESRADDSASGAGRKTMVG
jgi:putative nucleotidyltransferase with HDIG domain